MYLWTKRDKFGFPQSVTYVMERSTTPRSCPACTALRIDAVGAYLTTSAGVSEGHKSTNDVHTQGEFDVLRSYKGITAGQVILISIIYERHGFQFHIAAAYTAL